MSYVNYRKSLYRTGFRPIATNPYAATQLGITPFEPEILRWDGLGRHEQVFTPAGGQHLSGLGDIVPNQSTVTWVGEISGTPSKSVQDVLAAATAALHADGLSVINSSGLPFSVFDVDIQWSSSATVTLQILVNNGMGYGNSSDIESVINHEIYVASGIMPIGAITRVQPYGGTATTTPSGAAAATAAPVADLTGWLEQNAVYIGLGLLAMFIVPPMLERF